MENNIAIIANKIQKAQKKNQICLKETNKLISEINEYFVLKIVCIFINVGNICSVKCSPKLFKIIQRAQRLLSF